MSTVLFTESGIICSFEQIIDGHIKIVGEFNQSVIVSFSYAVLITADTVLIHIQVNCQLKLGYTLCLAKFF